MGLPKGMAANSGWITKEMKRGFERGCMAGNHREYSLVLDFRETRKGLPGVLVRVSSGLRNAGMPCFLPNCSVFYKNGLQNGKTAVQL